MLVVKRKLKGQIRPCNVSCVENVSCMREKLTSLQKNYIRTQCNALWAVCTVCRSQGSTVKKISELESKTLVLEERLRVSEILLQEKDRLVDHLKTEVLEAKTDRDKLFQLFQQQKLQKKPKGEK